MSKLRENIRKIAFLFTVIALTFAIHKPEEAKAATRYFVSHTVYDTNMVAHTVDDSDLVALISDPDSGAIYIYKSKTYGTKMCCDLKGNIEKVYDSTGTTLIRNLKTNPLTEETKETAKSGTNSSIKYGAWKAKGKKPSYKKIKKSYNGNIYSRKKHKWVEGKVKYLYGYKITWGKTKGAKGYLLQRYAPAEAKWITLKKINGNKTKNRSYTLTDTMGCTAKLRVVPFKSGKYGNPSATRKFAAGFCTKLDKYGWKVKTYNDKFFDEYTFLYQNEIRKKAGSQPLKWSNVLHDIGVYRLKTSGIDEHDNVERDVVNFANKANVKLPKSSITGKTYSVDNTSHGIAYNENLEAGGTDYKDIIDGWVRSGGHYGVMIDPDNKSGAVVTMSGNEDDDDVLGSGLTSIATFSGRKDFDSYWNSLR